MISCKNVLHKTSLKGSPFDAEVHVRHQHCYLHLEILPYDDNAAAHYGQIRANLEKKGTPIGVNEVYIAGHARSKSLILVTNNVREFERVEGLLLENWIDPK